MVTKLCILGMISVLQDVLCIDELCAFRFIKQLLEFSFKKWLECCAYAAYGLHVKQKYIIHLTRAKHKLLKTGFNLKYR